MCKPQYFFPQKDLDTQQAGVNRGDGGVPVRQDMEESPSESHSLSFPQSRIILQ